MTKIKQNSLFLIIITVIILIFSLSLFRNFDNNEVSEDHLQFINEAEQAQAIESEVEEEMIIENIVVDLKGAVNEPGVYVMNKGERIIDLIKRANGFHNEANQDAINLALLLEDEMVIFVPRQGEEVLNGEQVTITSSKADGKVDINRATQEQLEKIPGIGPAKAAAIISFREEEGPFKKIEDLVRVSGIGQKSLEAMSEFVIIK